eukprot:TRINITY_DN323_c0_g1_i2.p1 TRINITY_DN323_c0_g1~~TRINITY_DN323_c0_g1_i2.p1  ORF type:complete len:209 (+),score=27.84 TRINITY_DN323_c0_g1_i2:84-710(+)
MFSSSLRRLSAGTPLVHSRSMKKKYPHIFNDGSKHFLPYIRTPVDQEGVPLDFPDETPVGPDPRPKTNRAVYSDALSDSLRRCSTLRWFEQDPENARVFPRPHRPVVPEARAGMTLKLFLKKIGRDSDKHTSLFTSWEHFFSCRTEQLKKLGIPIRERKYLLRWMEYYRQGWEPRLIPLRSKAKKNANLEWRHKLITQKEKRKQLGLD